MLNRINFGRLDQDTDIGRVMDASQSYVIGIDFGTLSGRAVWSG